MRSELDIARAAALAGGAVLGQRLEDQGTRRTKSSATDFVTEADVASGVAVVREILLHEPDARFVVEEDEVYEQGPARQGTLDDGRVWVIDPLDGTTSFIHGYPCYSVSVALVESGRPVVGAVFDAARDEMHSAAHGLGAHRDESRVHVSKAAAVNEALVITGFPYDRGGLLDKQLNVLAAFLRTPVHGVRRDGSAAIDCCHVAGARADGFWEFGLKPWDMAAGVVILTEAGAAVTDTSGDAWDIRSDSICAANPILQPRMLEVIRSA